MPTLLLLLIAILLLPGTAGVVLAESIPEVSLAKGIFLYEGFQQSLSLTYNFNDSSNGKSSSSSNSFQEGYNASLKMSLFDPRILDANLQGGIVLDQTRSSGNETSSTGRSTSYQYNFSGSGLSRSRIPFTLLSLRNTNTILNTFISPTTTDNVSNEFGISFLNNKLQSKFTFTRNSIDTSVAGTSSSSLSNSYSYSASHQYGDVSTALNVSFSDQNGGTSNGDKLTSSNNNLGLTNYFSFGDRRAYSLFSSFQLYNTNVDNIPQRALTFAESFGAALGRALTFNADYSLTNNRNANTAGSVKEETINQGNLNLKHKLYESLFTDLFGHVSYNNRSDGNEDQYAVSGAVRYIKNLPSENQLSLGVSKGYNVVDRQVGSDTVTIYDERHANVHQGDVITLALSGGVLRRVNAVTSRNPIYTYVEGVDYVVNYALGRISILSGAGVSIDMDGAGTDLYITYTLFQDPKIKYATETLSLTSNLALYAKQLNVGAAWTQTKQSLISGPVRNNLQGSRSLSLYVNGNYDTYSGDLSYRNEAMETQSYQTLEGNGTSVWQFSQSTISLTAHDIYTRYDASLTAAAYNENSANLSLSFSRSIMTNAYFSLQANFSDARSDLRPTKNALGLQAKYNITFNLITINLTGQSIWVFDTGGTARNDSVYVNFARYF